MPRPISNLSLGNRERRPVERPICAPKLLTNLVIDGRSDLTYLASTCNWSVVVTFAALA